MLTPQSSASIHLPPIVGREREQAALDGWLDRMLRGRGGLVLVSGEAGIGKTTLVEDLRQRTEAHDVSAATGYCYDLTATVPYSVWLDFRRVMRAESDWPDWPVAAADEPSGVQHASRHAWFNQIIGYLDRRATTSPLLLILEDLHWADQASLDLLRVVARQIATMRVMIVATYRSDEVSQRHPLFRLLPALVQESRAERLDLNRFDRNGVDAFVRTRCGPIDDDLDRLVSYLYEHTEGNPLFLEEVLRTLVDEGVVSQSIDGWQVGELDRIVIPPLVHQFMQTRLDALSDATHRALEIAAVIGQVVPYQIWSAVQGADDARDLTLVVREAIGAHFIQQSESGENLTFRNALVRSALYDRLLLPERLVWHRKVAEAYLVVDPPDPDVIATHFIKAQDDRAIPWLIKAGDRAQRNYALRMAADRFQSALRLIGRPATPTRDHGWLLYRTARLLRFADPERGANILDQAAREATVVNDRVLEAYSIADRGMLRCFTGDIRRGLLDIETGIEKLRQLARDNEQFDRDVALWILDAPSDDDAPAGDREKADDQIGLITLRLGAHVAWLAKSGRFGESCRVGERYLDEIQGSAHPELTVVTVAGINAGLGTAFAHLGEPNLAQQAFARAREDVTDVLVGQFAVTELVDVQLRFAADDLLSRRRLGDQAEAAWERAGEALPAGVPARCAIASLLVLEGEWNEARRLARIEAARGLRMNRPHARVVLAQLAAWLGEDAAAVRRIHELLPDGPDTEPGNCDMPAALKMQHLVIEMLLANHDLAGVKTWLDAHGRWLEWSGATTYRPSAMLLWARYHALDGRLDQALACATDALALAEHPRQPLVLLAIHRLLGELSTDTGDHDGAKRHLTEALRLADVCAAVYERSLTQVAWARLAFATHDDDAATIWLTDARETLARLGAQPALADADDLAASIAERSGVRQREQPATAPVTYPAGLTAREVEILRLVAAGLSNRAIADALDLSIRTVERHISNIYIKIDAHNRVDATAFAIRYNLD